MADIFTPQSKTIQELFDGGNYYQVPSYQRPYSWDTEQVDDLWEDVYSAFDNDEEEYFLGSIILTKNGDNKYLDVVDGQQRLTTLMILFCVLRDLYYSKHKDITKKNRIEGRIKNLENGYERLKLRTQTQNQNQFEQEILNGINKGFTIEKVISSFAMTREIGILTLGYFMIGLPGETKETVQETFNLAKKIKPDFASWGTLVVFPGRRLSKLIQAGKYQGKLRTLRGKDGIVGTFFGKGNYIVFEDNLTIEQLREIAKKANREFYLRPQYIIQCLKNIRSFSDLSYYLNGGIEVLRTAIR